MEKKNKENRIVYAALIVVLTILSVLVIVSGAAARRAERNHGSDEVVSTEDKNDSISQKTPAVTKKLPEKKTDTVRTPDTEKESDTKEADAADVEPVEAEPELPEFVMPTEGVISKTHSESVLVYSMTMDDYRTHSGIDICTEPGADVRAAADGCVLEVWEDPMWGYCISVSHEGDAVSVYKNLTRESLLAVKTGDEVKQGQLIAAVGDSALSELADEPHLHFELKIGGESVDPCEYIGK